MNGQYIITIVFYLLSFKLLSQVEYGGIPLSKDSNLLSNDLISFGIDKACPLYYRDSITGEPIYGLYRKYPLDIIKNMVFKKVENKYIGLIKLYSKDADRIALYFDQFYLPPSAKLFFHDKKSTHGYYSDRNVVHLSEKKFLGPISNGEYTIVEINISENELYLAKIQLSEIAHYYLLKETTATDSYTDYSCDIDVNCPEGDAWCNQIRSVATLEYQNSKGEWIRACSGALINNINFDYSPYYLTAYHCVENLTDFSKTRFTFNYQWNDCLSGGVLSSIAAGGLSVVGSELIGFCDVTWSDNALLKISEPIPLQYNVYFAGWNIENRNLWDNVHCIHHPGVNEKKITAGQIQYYAGPKWDVYWDDGAILHGSSGAPVFLDEDKLIIGTINGGYEYDCIKGTRHDLVGKLKDCFPYSNGIKDALAGSNNNVMSLPGIDPIRSCQANILIDGILPIASMYRASKNDILIQSSKNIEIGKNTYTEFWYDSDYTLTAGERIVFSVNNRIDVHSTAQLRCQIAPCTVSEEECGFNYFGKKAQATVDEGKEIATNEILVYPNPANNSITISAPVLRDFTIVDIMERIVYSHHQTDSDNIIINTENLPTGIYTLRVNHSDFIHTQKIIIQH